jgi:hypothetical protein
MHLSFTNHVLLLLLATAATTKMTFGFLSPSKSSSSVKTHQRQQQQQQQTITQRQQQQSSPLATNLNMAFKYSEEESNIYDGPMALTKERDACGVGFIANTQSGG